MAPSHWGPMALCPLVVQNKVLEVWWQSSLSAWRCDSGRAATLLLMYNKQYDIWQSVSVQINHAIESGIVYKPYSPKFDACHTNVLSFKYYQIIPTASCELH